MVFPLPSLLSSIEELLKEVEELQGVIVVSDSCKARFVSISHLSPLLMSLKTYPKGEQVAEILFSTLEDSTCTGSAKPVLVLQDDGSFWLGMMDVDASSSKLHLAIQHLNRCFELESY